MVKENVMKRKKTTVESSAHAREPRARTPEGRDNQLIALAYDLVEQRLREGSATSQETTYFLKLAAQREKAELERSIMQEQRKLLVAKTEAIKSAREVEELYTNALSAFQTYKSTADNHE